MGRSTRQHAASPTAHHRRVPGAVDCDCDSGAPAPRYSPVTATGRGKYRDNVLEPNSPVAQTMVDGAHGAVLPQARIARARANSHTQLSLLLAIKYPPGRISL